MQNILKKEATAYMISGDMIGYHGKRKNEMRKINMLYRSDRDQIEKDWYTTGVDMQNALNSYSKKKELGHEC